MTVYFTANSQNTSTITITSDQLRTTNLIFAEHKEYSEIIPLLKQENSNLLKINQTWVRTDSLRTVQIRQQDEQIIQQKQHVEKLERSLKLSNTTWGTIAGVFLIVTVTLICLK